MEKIIKIIADELQVKPSQVEATIKLIDEGNTIPFIARYRKEVTGGLSDETLRTLGDRLNYLRNLEQRKEEVIKSIDEQGKLTDEILKQVAISKTLAEVEDVYRPYKQKKKTRATVAKAKGLEPLAKIIIEQKETRDINEIAKDFINIDSLSDEDKKNKDKVVANEQDAICGALDIIAENISDNAKYRKEIKRICYREGLIVTKAAKEDEKSSVSQFFHILGSVDQQRGCCDLGDDKFEITIYTSCCNVNKGIYYYTTYENHQITAVDMNKEDLNAKKLIRFPLVCGEQIRWQN